MYNDVVRLLPIHPELLVQPSSLAILLRVAPEKECLHPRSTGVTGERINTAETTGRLQQALWERRIR